MKKQKIKKFFMRNIFVILSSFFIFWAVFWSFTSYLITSQYSTSVWSNNSIISFTWTATKEWYYINNEDNSAIIGNYFEWYYFDSLFWFFKLDWSANQYENVRITDSTDACTTWYWYKLWWKAFSEQAWYIDFDYNSSTFVYYCLDDGKLHGTAFSDYIWFQDFEWIWVSIVNSITDLTQNVSDSLFMNDTTTVNISSSSLDWIETLWWNITQTDVYKESIFYIVK